MSPEAGGPGPMPGEVARPTTEIVAPQDSVVSEVTSGSVKPETAKKPQRPPNVITRWINEAARSRVIKKGIDANPLSLEERGKALAESGHAPRDAREQQALDAYIDRSVTRPSKDAPRDWETGLSDIDKATANALVNEVAIRSALNAELRASKLSLEVPHTDIEIRNVNGDIVVVASRQNVPIDAENTTITDENKPTTQVRDINVYVLTPGKDSKLRMIGNTEKVTDFNAATLQDAVMAKRMLRKALEDVDDNNVVRVSVSDLSEASQLVDSETGKPVPSTEMPEEATTKILDIRGYKQAPTYTPERQKNLAIAEVNFALAHGEKAPTTVFVGDKKLASTLQKYGVELPNNAEYPPKEVPTTPEAKQVTQQEAERTAFDDLVKKLGVTYDLSKADDRQRALDGIHALYDMKTGSKMLDRDNPFAQMGLRLDAADAVAHVMRQAKGLDAIQATLRQVKLQELSDPATYRKVLFSYLTQDQQLQYLAEQEALALARGREEALAELAKQKNTTPATP